VPRIVQIFHQWQLVFKAQVYWMNSLMETLCAWFRIIQHERMPPYVLQQEAAEDGERARNLQAWYLAYHPGTSVEPLAIEIFGKVPWCKRHWWPNGVPGEEDQLVMEAAAKGNVF
jgi:hypothetical protein